MFHRQLGQYSSCSAAQAENGQFVELSENSLPNLWNNLTPQTVQIEQIGSRLPSVPFGLGRLCREGLSGDEEPQGRLEVTEVAAAQVLVSELRRNEEK